MDRVLMRPIKLGRQQTADHCAWRETKELCYFSSKHNRKMRETFSTDFNTVFLTQSPSSKSPDIDVGAHEAQSSITGKALRVRCQKVKEFLIVIGLVSTHVNADVQVADYLPGASVVAQTIDSGFN
jgi:hypothetical protein